MATTRRSRAESPAGAGARAPQAPVATGGEMRSPVTWLVLSLVMEQPSHGYELSRRYEERFGTFAAMSVPRIYAALDRLRDRRMIEVVAPDTAKPVPKQHLMRRSYRVTPAGIEAYRGWVADRMREDPRRTELLARISSAAGLGLDGLLDVIDRYERACVEDLAALPPGLAGTEDPDLSTEQLARRLIADQQRRELDARREWAEHARNLIRARMLAGGAGSTRARRS